MKEIKTQGFMCDEWLFFSGALDLLLENQKMRHYINKTLLLHPENYS